MCQKRPLNKEEAQSALYWIRYNRGRKGFKKRKERRAYFCRECGAYHLTSMQEHHGKEA